MHGYSIFLWSWTEMLAHALNSCDLESKNRDMDEICDRKKEINLGKSDDVSIWN